MAKANNTMSTIAATLAGTSADSMQAIPERAYLDAAGIKLIVDAFKGEATVQNKWQKAADYARSQGVTSSMIRAGGEARDWFMHNVVMLTFTKEELAAHNAPKTELKGWATDDPRRALRDHVAKQRGSRINKIAMHLLTEQEKKAAEATKQTKDKGSDSDNDGEEKPTKKTAPLADTLKKQLADMIVRIQKADEENLEGFAPDRLCKALNAAIALIR